MGVKNEANNDLQDLARAFVGHDGASPLRAPEDTVRAIAAEDMWGALLALGWLPPTPAAHAKASIKRAWEAESDDEAFRVLKSAADVLEVELVDPFADTLVAV